MELPYISAKGEVDLIVNYELAKVNHVINHDYSIVVYQEPWIAIPINLNERIIQVTPNSSVPIVHIPTKEIKVRQALQSPNISARLWQCSTELDKADWMYEENPEANSYFCFNGALFIAALWTANDPLTDIVLVETSEMRFNKFYQKTALEQLYYMYGIFLCEIEFNIESHGFVLYLTEDKVTVYNTYGGEVGFFITEFDKKYWIDSLIRFNKSSPDGQYHIYTTIWGIPIQAIDNTIAQYRRRNKKIRFEAFKTVRIY